MKIINQHRELLVDVINMKLVIAIVLIVLMVGVTPAFAASSPAYQQNAASISVKEVGSDIEDQSDDIGDYIVIDPSNESDTSGEDGVYNDQSGENSDYIVTAASDEDSGCHESDNQLDDSGDYVVADAPNEYDTPDKYGNYADESDSVNVDNLDENSNYNDSNVDNPDQSDNNGDYIIVNSLDVSDQPDDIVPVDGPVNNQLDENSDYTNEIYTESEYNIGPSDELDDNTTDNDQSFEGGTTSQADTNVSITHKPLIVTLVDSLCGVVQSTLGGVDSICKVLANELATIL